MNQLPKWAELANDYFNAGLDVMGAERWQREIKHHVAGVKPQDVCDAIRNNRNQELRRKISVSDIVSWLKQAVPSSEKQLMSCRLCNRGWLNYVPDAPEFFTLDQYACGTQQSLPCTCKAGEYHMRTKYPNGGITDIQKKAVPQRLRYMRLLEEEGQDL